MQEKKLWISSHIVEKNTLEDFLEYIIEIHVKLSLPLKIDVGWIRENNIGLLIIIKTKMYYYIINLIK